MSKSKATAMGAYQAGCAANEKHSRAVMEALKKVWSKKALDRLAKKVDAALPVLVVQPPPARAMPPRLEKALDGITKARRKADAGKEWAVPIVYRDTKPENAAFTCTIPVRTRNPLNGQTGNSKLAGILKSKRRRAERNATVLSLLSRFGAFPPCCAPWLVTLTRVAPSNGLDDDSLPASMKAIRDGVADWLGLASDRDERITWRYEQRRGKPRQYAVEIRIERREA